VRWQLWTTPVAFVAAFAVACIVLRILTVRNIPRSRAQTTRRPPSPPSDSAGNDRSAWCRKRRILLRPVRPLSWPRGRERRIQRIGWMLAILVFSVGCSPAGEAPDAARAPARHRQPSTISSIHATASPSPSPGARPSLPPNPLTPMPASRPRGDDSAFYRASDGFTLAILGRGSPRDRTWYRIYGPNWEPRTPLLRVPVRLDVGRGLRHGFVGEASASDRTGRETLHAWIRVEPDGTLTRLPQPATSVPTKPLPGDVRFKALDGRLAAYRPATGQVLRPAAPDTAPGHERDWQVSENGGICYTPVRRDGSIPAYWARTDSRAWHRLDLRSALPPSAARQIMVCHAAAGRVVIYSGDDSRGVIAVYTVRVPAGHPVTTFRIRDRRINPWVLLTLPDGRTVFQTDRTGVMVAKDRSNTSFVFRPAPIEAPPEQGLMMADGELIHLPAFRGHTIVTSRDGGRSWRTVDLRAGNWSAGSSPDPR
jgi:hypothetical protein